MILIVTEAVASAIWTITTVTKLFQSMLLTRSALSTEI
jgi:hypothetical protein